MTDCLIIGYNDSNFADDVRLMKSMGTESVAYKDFRLGYVEYKDKPYRAMDILSHFYFQDVDLDYRPFHNADLLWPVILCLGSYLYKRGFSFDYINIFNFEKDKLKEKLLREEILTVAVTTTIYTTVKPILEVVSFIKKYSKRPKIIIGGLFISQQLENMTIERLQSIYKYMGADFYIRSYEGEHALAQIVKTLKEGGDFNKINNIAYKRNEDFVFTPLTQENNSLHENRIDYSLFSQEDYGEVVALRTSKSCPFSCSFCSFPLRSDKYTFLSVKEVEEELNEIRKLEKVTTLNFVDDTINVPKNRFKEILRMMIKNGYDFKWHCFYRCDYGDVEMIELMREAGCEHVFLGVESVDEGILKNMNKKAQVDDYMKFIPLLKKAGITVFVSTLIGFPGETYETARKTMDFINEVKPDFFRPQIWWCDPITPIVKKKGGKCNIEGYGYKWSHYTMDSDTAADIFEQSFLYIDGSIWVPEPGFNPYAMFYLKARNMTMTQIKTFLRGFNNVVKARLISPDNRLLLAEQFDHLKKSARYHTPYEPVEKYRHFAPMGYKQSEQFWVGEYRDETISSSGSFKVLPDQSNEKYSSSDSIFVNNDIIDKVALKYNASVSDFILAIYAMLLHRMDGSAKFGIVLFNDKTAPFPISIEISPSSVFSGLVRKVKEKSEKAHEYSFYAFNILENPLRMEQFGLMRTVFRFGFIEVKEEGDITQHLSGFYGGPCERLHLVITVTKMESKTSLRFFYKKSLVSKNIESLRLELKSLLETHLGHILECDTGIKRKKTRAMSLSETSFTI